MALSIQEYQQYSQDLARRGTKPPFAIDAEKGTVTLLNEAGGKPHADSTVIHFDAKGKATSIEMGIGNTHKTLPMTEHLADAVKGAGLGRTESDVVANMAKRMAGNQGHGYVLEHSDSSQSVARGNPTRFNEAVNRIVDEERIAQQRVGNVQWHATNSPVKEIPQIELTPQGSKDRLKTIKIPAEQSNLGADVRLQINESTGAVSIHAGKMGTDGRVTMTEAETGALNKAAKAMGIDPKSATEMIGKNGDAWRSVDTKLSAGDVLTKMEGAGLVEKGTSKNVVNFAHSQKWNVPDPKDIVHAPSGKVADPHTPSANEPHGIGTSLLSGAKKVALKTVGVATALAAAGSAMASAPEGKRLEAAAGALAEHVAPGSTSVDSCKRTVAQVASVAGYGAGIANLGISAIQGAAVGSAVPVAGTAAGAAAGVIKGVATSGLVAAAASESTTVLGNGICDQLAARAKQDVANVKATMAGQTAHTPNGSTNIHAVAKPQSAQGAQLGG